MRVLRHRRFVPVAAVAASTVFFACHRGDSILLVEVAGDLRLAPASFQVTVEPAQAAERTFKVAPKNGATVTLPTSLSIELAPNLTGPVAVTVSAFDVNGFMIAYGSATQTDINVGGQTIVVVTLTSNFPPPVDAGMDALSGTGGGGVDASGSGGVGGAGVAGSGGGAGSGGSGGSSGTAGRAGSGGAGGVTGSGGKGGAGGSTGTGGMGGIGGMIGTGGAGGMGGRGTGGSATGGTNGTGGAIDAGGATDARGDA